MSTNRTARAKRAGKRSKVPAFSASWEQLKGKRGAALSDALRRTTNELHPVHKLIIAYKGTQGLDAANALQAALADVCERAADLAAVRAARGSASIGDGAAQGMEYPSGLGTELATLVRRILRDHDGESDESQLIACAGYLQNVPALRDALENPDLDHEAQHAIAVDLYRAAARLRRQLPTRDRRGNPDLLALMRAARKLGIGRDALKTLAAGHGVKLTKGQLDQLERRARKGRTQTR